MDHQFASLSSDVMRHIFLFIREIKLILFLSCTCKYIKNICDEIIEQYMSQPVHIDYNSGFTSPSFFWFKIDKIGCDRNNDPRTIKYQGSRGFITTRKQMFKNMYSSNDNADGVCKYSLNERKNIFRNKTLSDKKNIMIGSCSVCQRHRDDHLMNEETILYMNL